MERTFALGAFTYQNSEALCPEVPLEVDFSMILWVDLAILKVQLEIATAGSQYSQNI